VLSRPSADSFAVGGRQKGSSDTGNMINIVQFLQLADALLKYETLDAEDVAAIIAGNSDQVAKKKISSASLLLEQRRVPTTPPPVAVTPAAVAPTVY
jgi:hypothetical protein